MTDTQPDTQPDAWAIAQATPSPHFNSRQWRLAQFAVRKSLQWSVAEFNPRVVVLTRGSSSPNPPGRQMVLYPSGVTGTGMRVALIDTSLPQERQLRFISQRAAWNLVAEGAL